MSEEAVLAVSTEIEQGSPYALRLSVNRLHTQGNKHCNCCESHNNFRGIGHRVDHSLTAACLDSERI